MLTWETGSNLGRLARMFRLARRLKSRGDQVLGGEMETIAAGAPARVCDLVGA